MGRIWVVRGRAKEAHAPSSRGFGWYGQARSSASFNPLQQGLVREQHNHVWASAYMVLYVLAPREANCFDVSTAPPGCRADSERPDLRDFTSASHLNIHRAHSHIALDSPKT